MIWAGASPFLLHLDARIFFKRIVPRLQRQCQAKLNRTGNHTSIINSRLLDRYFPHLRNGLIHFISSYSKPSCWLTLEIPPPPWKSRRWLQWSLKAELAFRMIQMLAHITSERYWITTPSNESILSDPPGTYGHGIRELVSWLLTHQAQPQ